MVTERKTVGRDSVVDIATVRGSNPGGARVSAPRNVFYYFTDLHHIWRIYCSSLIVRRSFIISANRHEVRTTCLYIYADMRVCVGDLYGAYSNFGRLINTLNPELNPICCLLALLGAHHFLHVSRIRVKSLTLRLLMSYTGWFRRNLQYFGKW